MVAEAAVESEKAGDQEPNGLSVRPGFVPCSDHLLILSPRGLCSRALPQYHCKD